MAHWDDSGAAVGYEGEDGDELIRHRLCGHEFYCSHCGEQKCKCGATFECSCGAKRP